MRGVLQQTGSLKMYQSNSGLCNSISEMGSAAIADQEIFIPHERSEMAKPCDMPISRGEMDYVQHNTVKYIRVEDISFQAICLLTDQCLHVIQQFPLQFMWVQWYLCVPVHVLYDVPTHAGHC